MALNTFRDLYTGYGKTVVLDLRLILMVHGKIGSIGFAATALSSQQVRAAPLFHSLTL